MPLPATAAPWASALLWWSQDGEGTVLQAPCASLPASALLSVLLPGMGRGARETVLGTLGKATILRIPPKLQDLTLTFKVAVWKRDTEDPQKKLILLKYSDGNYTNYMEERTRFQKMDFSLEILNTSREDRQLYEYIVTKGSEEEVWQIQLEVYGETCCFGSTVLDAPRLLRCWEQVWEVGGGQRGWEMPTLMSRCCSESRTLLQPHLGIPRSLWVCVDHVPL